MRRLKSLQVRRASIPGLQIEVHVGTLRVLAGVYMKSGKGTICPGEVLYVAELMVLSWSMDLGLLAR